MAEFVQWTDWMEAVSVIDGKTNAVIASISVTGVTGWRSVSVNPSTNIVYATASFPLSIDHPIDSPLSAVIIIDGKTNAVIATVSVGTDPGEADCRISINPSTNIVYVTNSVDKTVIVIDGNTNAVIATIPVGRVPVDVCVNASTNIAYVATSEGVSVIDGKTNAVIATIPVSSIATIPVPSILSVNTSTNIAYVATSEGVSVIDGKTNAVIATIPIENIARVSVNSLTNIIYVGKGRDGSVSAIDGKTNAVIATIPVGTNAAGHPPIPANVWSYEIDAVAINPSTNIAYVIISVAKAIPIEGGVSNTN